MSEWSIELEIRGIVAPSEDAADELVERLRDHAGVLAVYPDGYAARVSVNADTPEAALTSAIGALKQAASSAGVAVSPIVRVESSTEDFFDAELAEPTIPSLVGVAEVAQRLGVSRQRVSELAGTDHFPAPVARLASGPIWSEPTLMRFIEQWERRPGRKQAA